MTCFWATDFGIDWWNLLGVKNPAAQAAIILACRLMISESYGVVRINSVDVQLSTATRRVTINYNIDTIYSRNLTNTVTVP